MSIFDVLTNGTLGTVLDSLTNPAQRGKAMGGMFDGLGGALDAIAGQARSAAGNLSRNVPGGLGGMLGAGALGAVLGNLLSSDAVKGIALAGASAVAWNFYQKWAGKNAGEAQAAAPALEGEKKVDPVTQLIVRAMTYAARADGQIDQVEQERMDAIMKNLAPGENISAFIEQVRKEPIDPAKIAAEVQSPEQGEDVYRLSCAVIDIDHFMETSYLDALAKALRIPESTKKELEAEAENARQALQRSLPA